MPKASVLLLLFFVSYMDSVLDVDIMHTEAPVISREFNATLVITINHSRLQV